MEICFLVINCITLEIRNFRNENDIFLLPFGKNKSYKFYIRDYFEDHASIFARTHTYALVILTIR